MKLIRKLVYYGISVLELIVNFKRFILLIPLFLRKKAFDDQIVELRHPPIKMTVRSAMDIWSIKETFLDAFYTRYGVPIEDEWMVIDIGAGIGDFSIFAAFGKPDVVVHAYEPFPTSYRLLIKNLTLNAMTNVIAFQKAVWCREGTLALDLSVREPLQIMSKDVDFVDGDQQTITVQALSLQAVLEESGITRVDMLKLDCEGAEYEILMNAPSEILSRIERIIMEYHDVDSDHHHEILIAFLESEGYFVTWHENVVHDDIGYLFAKRN